MSAVIFVKIYSYKSVKNIIWHEKKENSKYKYRYIFEKCSLHSSP